MPSSEVQLPFEFKTTEVVQRLITGLNGLITDPGMLESTMESMRVDAEMVLDSTTDQSSPIWVEEALGYLNHPVDGMLEDVYGLPEMAPENRAMRTALLCHLSQSEPRVMEWLNDSGSDQSMRIILLDAMERDLTDIRMFGHIRDLGNMVDDSFSRSFSTNEPKVMELFQTTIGQLKQRINSASDEVKSAK
jgi:hypothetical protein